MEKLKYALFTGCTAKQSTPEQMMSTMAVAKKLDIELIELTEASCCGASHLQDYDDFLSLVLNARNIAYAEKHGLTMVTICNTCQLNTAMTKHRLDNNAELKAKVNVKLGKAGRRRNLGWRPAVRGMAMHAVQHPHGGGEGKGQVGGQAKDIWGNRIGTRTRRNKKTERFIIRHRRTKRRLDAKK